MKKLLHLLAIILFAGSVLAAPVDEPKPVKPVDGVYVLGNPFSSTVLELKSGRFRYWFSTDVNPDSQPKMPLTGTFRTAGESVTLDNDKVSDRHWTFRLFRGEVTLWRDHAIERWAARKELDGYGILRPSTKSAEEAWKDPIEALPAKPK